MISKEDARRTDIISKFLPAIKFPIVPELTKSASSFPSNSAAFFCNSKKFRKPINQYKCKNKYKKIKIINKSGKRGKLLKFHVLNRTYELSGKS